MLYTIVGLYRKVWKKKQTSQEYKKKMNLTKLKILPHPKINIYKKLQVTFLKLGLKSFNGSALNWKFWSKYS